MRGVLIVLGAIAVCWMLASFAHMYRERRQTKNRPTALETVAIGASAGTFLAVLIINAP